MSRIVSNFIIVLQVIMVLLLAAFIPDKEDQNSTKIVKAGIAVEGKDEDVKEFLTEAADARMMDAAEGKLAVEKGTVPAIRNYGQLMIKDQTMLLDEIKSIAKRKNITLPKQISEEKQEGREELASKEGEDFDDKFIKMMIIDHKRDIRLFKRASEFSDEEVSAFARKYLPTIESHLENIERIREDVR